MAANEIDQHREPVPAIKEAATGTAVQPDIDLAGLGFLRPMLKPAFWLLMVCLLAGLYVNAKVDATWSEHRTTYQLTHNTDGQLVYSFRGKVVLLPATIPYEQSPLRQAALDQVRGEPRLSQQWVSEQVSGGEVSYSQLTAKFHFGFWSLLPAVAAIGLCLLTREPLTALFGGIVTGALMLGRFDITDAVLLPNLASESAAGVLMLYLWLLGGLMGIWSRTGAAQAFAEFMTE
ncbi:MAG: hypothetical protein ACI9GW_002657, partial [Halieaceae bacterium]